MLGGVRRPGVLAAVLVSLSVAACGGSNSSSATSTTTSSSAAASSAPASSQTTASSSTANPLGTSTTGASVTVTSNSSTSAGPDTNVRLPAKFTIRTGGTLFPHVVAAPKHTTIVLTVRSQDGRRHTLTLATPHAYTMSVAPGGPTRLVLNGLANGAYVVRVDGAVRGRLIVGAAPGP
jgi:hypothetical protein